MNLQMLSKQSLNFTILLKIVIEYTIELLVLGKKKRLKHTSEDTDIIQTICQ